jgi:hypothetical protein
MHGGQDPPEGFSNWALRMIYYFLFVVGVVVALMINYERGLFVPVSNVAVTRAVEPILPRYGADVMYQGTIKYYPNNVGEQMPYIRYSTKAGVMTKALLVANSGDLPPTGTPIIVYGRVEHEHVRVTSLQ